MRFFEKAIDFVVHLVKGAWSSELMFDCITGLLYIIGAISVGLILLLLYTGKIQSDIKIQ
jgi:hypothetical protein